MMRAKIPRPTILVILLATTLGVLLMLPRTRDALRGPAPRELKTGEFLRLASEKEVLTARWNQETMSGRLAEGETYVVTVPTPNSSAGAEILRKLESAKVEWNIERPSLAQSAAGFAAVLGFPLLVLLAVYRLLIRPNSKAR